MSISADPDSNINRADSQRVRAKGWQQSIAIAQKTAEANAMVLQRAVEEAGRFQASARQFCEKTALAASRARRISDEIQLVRTLAAIVGGIVGALCVALGQNIGGAGFVLHAVLGGAIGWAGLVLTNWGAGS